MSIKAVEHALSSLALSRALKDIDWSIPLVQTVHILTVCIVFGSAMVIYLTIFGRRIAQGVSKQHLATTIWICIGILACTGALLIIAEPDRTLRNPAFYTKMSLLVGVSCLTLWLQRAPSEERIPARYKVLSVLSVGLWIGIVVAGRMIAYVESF
jgi:hypothetical protein